MQITPAKHTAVVLNYLRSQTSEVILFYSGGKDSVVLLDLLSKHFDKVYCVLMEFLPGLRHLQPGADWVKKYPNAELIRLQHWMTTYYMKHNYYCFPQTNKNFRALKLKDIEEKAKKLTGCQWIVFGHKKSDSMHRLLMLRGYKFDAINEKGKKVYPLAAWSKKLALRYIEVHDLFNPVKYSDKNAQGVDLTLDVFLWLRQHYPDDLEKIFKIFPFSRSILYEHDTKNAPPSGI